MVSDDKRHLDIVDDPDKDGLSNFYEYAFGGDPTNAVDAGYAQSGGLVEQNGTNYLPHPATPSRPGSAAGQYARETNER